jgi:hypothetical protein
VSDELRIEIDLESSHVRAGDVLRGRVRLASAGGTNARGVELEVGWRTRGRGDTDEKQVHAEQLHGGDVPPGGLELDFAAPLPAVPWTYRGDVIKIEWWCRVRIDRALARDPRREAEFVVR